MQATCIGVQEVPGGCVGSIVSFGLRSKYEVKDEAAVREESLEREGKGELNIGLVGREECRLLGESQLGPVLAWKGGVLVVQ